MPLKKVIIELPHIEISSAIYQEDVLLLLQRYIEDALRSPEIHKKIEAIKDELCHIALERVKQEKDHSIIDYANHGANFYPPDHSNPS